MSIFEAIKGAQAEVSRIRSPIEQARKIASYARVFAAELLGLVSAIPYGVRALALHRSLPSPDARLGRHQGSVTLLRDVRYGARPRNTLDIYLPPNVEPPHLEAALPSLAQRRAPSSQAPPTGAGASSEVPGGEAHASKAPLLLFVHGGVWASGSGWHYAPLATRLAQAGVVTLVMQYTLYPQALVPSMVSEVGAALTWALNHAAALGGDPQRVVLAGHSAGAQMAAMALLHRAADARTDGHAQPPAVGVHADNGTLSPASGRGSSSSSRSQGDSPALAAEVRAAAAAAEAAGEGIGASSGGIDARMPCLLVGLAGVYNLAKHYEYEQRRGVHALSTMERAVGGPPGLITQSPATVLALALAAAHRLQPQHGPWSSLQADAAGAELLGLAAGAVAAARPSNEGVPEADTQQQAAGAPAAEAASGAQGSKPPFYQSFELAGEAIAQRVGFRPPTARGGAARAVRTAPREARSARGRPGLDGAAAQREPGKGGGGGGTLGDLGFTLEDAARLPPHLLMSSLADKTVPWHESAEMYWMLHAAGIPVQHLLYDSPAHANFVTAWHPLPAIGSGVQRGAKGLPAFASDLVRVVVDGAGVGALPATNRG